MFLFDEWPWLPLTPLHVLPFLVLFPIILLDMQPNIKDLQIIQCLLYTEKIKKSEAFFSN